MTELNTIWAQIAPYLSGLGLGGILSLILGIVLKGSFNKAVNSLNVSKIAEEATNKALAKIKSLSFTHDIAPIVEEKLTAATKAQAKVLKKELDEIRHNYENVVEILGNLAAYFDGSMVSDEVKATLHASLDKAVNKPVPEVTSTVEIETEEVVTPEIAATEPPKKRSKAVR